MYKPKMANSLQRIILLATIVSAILIKAEAQQDDTATDNGVLPVVTEDSDETVDILSNPINGGLAGMISPMVWPISYTILRVMDIILQTFGNQKLPCTLWSLVPMRIACTPLQ